MQRLQIQVHAFITEWNFAHHATMQTYFNAKLSCVMKSLLLQVTTVASSNSLPQIQHDLSSTTSCDSNPTVSSSIENTEEVIILYAYMYQACICTHRHTDSFTTAIKIYLEASKICLQMLKCAVIEAIIYQIWLFHNSYMYLGQLRYKTQCLFKGGVYGCSCCAP